VTGNERAAQAKAACEEDAQAGVSVFYGLSYGGHGVNRSMSVIEMLQQVVGRWRSALRLLNSALARSKLSSSLGVRDGTGFYRFHCPGFDRRRTVGRPDHVPHPATKCLPISTTGSPQPQSHRKDWLWRNPSDHIAYRADPEASWTSTWKLATVK
jgi:hypothetical protein